jgi:SulP family sulfate permease
LTGFERPRVGDLVAGLSVALVLVPQAIAYAALAGLPPEVGLVAGTLPAIVAAFFVSSPYLQTGPTALTALLVGGALASHAVAGSQRYVELAAILAILVGVFRVLFGVVRLGIAAYFVSRPVLTGFTTGAAMLIIGSQVPTILGVSVTGRRVGARAVDALSDPEAWSASSILLGVVTIVIALAGKRLHRAFPSVLAAVSVAWLLSVLIGYDGATVGEIPVAWPALDLALPWSETWALIVPALVIALIGFAEPSSIARTYAAADRQPWSADREFVSQGVANLVAGATGAMPVGGSFGRSSLNRAAGAKTRWSGAITGLALLAFLPAAGVLSSLPSTVLAAVVISAVVSLLRFDRMVEMWRLSRWQSVTAVATMLATLALDPRVDRAILLGLGCSVAVHLARELEVWVDAEFDDGHLAVAPHGVLWFGSINRISERMLAELAAHPETRTMTVDLRGVGRIDLTAAYELAEIADDAEADGGVVVRYTGLPPHSRRLLGHVLHDELIIDDGSSS